jgi:hypothetical protein
MKRDEGPLSCHACARRLEVRCGDWRVLAVQRRTDRGHLGGYEVFVEHRTGARVPPGPNLHGQLEDAQKEMKRLEKLLGWDRGEPRGFEWTS